jgi:hypothetical protein
MTDLVAPRARHTVSIALCGTTDRIPRCSSGTNTPTTHRLFNTPEIPAQDIVLPVSFGAHGSVIKKNSHERIAGRSFVD